MAASRLSRCLRNNCGKNHHRIGIACPCPLDKFKYITTSAANFHPMNRVLRDAQFLGQLPLIKPSFLPKLHQQHGKAAVCQSSLRLCHATKMQRKSFDNVLWSIMVHRRVATPSPQIILVAQPPSIRGDLVLRVRPLVAIL